jgi:ketosteroid isomerase-like protein
MARERAWKQPSGKAEDKTSEIALLSQTEDAWMAARLLGKSKIVEQLVDDAYRGATSRGLPQNKKEFMQAVDSSAGAFAQFVHSDRAIEVLGNVAISTGVATLSSPKRRHAFRYLRVFSKTKGKWKLIASQSTPLPAA